MVHHEFHLVFAVRSVGYDPRSDDLGEECPFVIVAAQVIAISSIAGLAVGLRINVGELYMDRASLAKYNPGRSTWDGPPSASLV